MKKHTSLGLLVILALTVLLARGVQAQDIDSIDSGEPDEKTEQLDMEGDIQSRAGNGASPQMSPVARVEQDPQLLALAPFTEVAPGVCLVISDMLADFCQSNPDDASCKPE